MSTMFKIIKGFTALNCLTDRNDAVFNMAAADDALECLGRRQLQLVAGPEPQVVFAGSNRCVNLCWRNLTSSVNETDIQSRIMQLTSATAVCVDEAPWKKLQVLPGQTVLKPQLWIFRRCGRRRVFWLSGLRAAPTSSARRRSLLIQRICSPVGNSRGSQ